MVRHIKALSLIIIASFFLISCGSNSEADDKKSAADRFKVAAPDPMQNKGIGPIKAVTLGELDQASADEGMVLFENLCTACHKVGRKFIGPDLTGVTDRRTPEWVMNMIMNPEEMTQKDPLAKQLLIDFNGAPMANQNVSEADARKILEYFRTLKP